MIASRRIDPHHSAKVHPNDARQAQYLRDLLLDEIELAASLLAARRAKLAKRLPNGEGSATARIPREIEAREKQQRELTNLVAAIERRFGDHWAIDLTA